jgi:hypothetical protein
MTEANGVLASVSPIPIRVIKILPSGYSIPDPLPWAALVSRCPSIRNIARAAVDVQHCNATRSQREHAAPDHLTRRWCARTGSDAIARHAGR